jgi:hypothetical protein
MEGLKVGLQIPSILFFGDALHSYRRISTLTAIGSLAGWHINQMHQRVALAFGFPCRSLHYLEQSR